MAEPLAVRVSHSTFGGFTEPGGVPLGVITAGINGWLHTRWQHPGPGNSTARDMAVQSVGFWPRKGGGARRRWQEEVAGEGGRKRWQEEVAGRSGRRKWQAGLLSPGLSSSQNWQG